MKQLVVLFLLLGGTVTAFAQQITGDWIGTLETPAGKLPVVFHILKEGKHYRSVMDSPEQGVTGIVMDETVVDKHHVRLKLAKAGIEYSADLKNGILTGTFSQMGMQLPLNMERMNEEAKEAVAMRRPQEPKPPFPYHSEDVVFRNHEAGVELHGTLTLPLKKERCPVVVLVSGSGPQDRNETILGHQPFLVIADYLTRRGIGVLRYDDRGAGQSTGNFAAATTFDFAGDAEAAVSFLKMRPDVDASHIGIVGHSEGGLIAPIVAARNKNVDFIVLLAGPGLSGGDILLRQQQLIGRANGAAEEDLTNMKELNGRIFGIIRGSDDPDAIREELTGLLNHSYDDLPESEKNGQTKEEYAQSAIRQLTTPWMLGFIRFDPAETLRKVSCPVLAMNGSLDLQVPPKENLEAIARNLEKAGNTNVRIVELEKLNHLFQECSTGAPSEYAKIEQTIAPKALETLGNWIEEQVRRDQ